MPAAAPDRAEKLAGAPPPRLAVFELVKRYGKVVAVDGLDLTVNAGEVVALTGPNGSGKSTTLKCVAGLLAASDGVIARPEPGISFIPDDPSGLDQLTVREYVSLVGSLYRRPGGYAARAQALLDAFNLSRSSQLALSGLSHGMRRQVAIVAGLAARQRLTVLDEAAAALDPEAKLVLSEALRAHAAAGGAVLLATQELAFADRTCDRVYLLNHGELLAEGSPAQLAAEFDVPAGSPARLEEVFVAAVGGLGDWEELRRALAR